MDNLNKKNKKINSISNNKEIDFERVINNGEKIDLKLLKKLFNGDEKENINNIIKFNKILREKKLEDIGVDDKFISNIISNFTEKEAGNFLLYWGFYNSNLKLDKNNIDILLEKNPKGFFDNVLNKGNIFFKNINFEINNNFFEKLSIKYPLELFKIINHFLDLKDQVNGYQSILDKKVKKIIDIGGGFDKNKIEEFISKIDINSNLGENSIERKKRLIEILNEENLSMNEEQEELFFSILSNKHSINLSNQWLDEKNLNIKINEIIFDNINDFIEKKILDEGKLKDGYLSYDLFNKGFISKETYLKVLNSIDFNTFINTCHDDYYKFINDESLNKHSKFFKILFEEKKDFYLNYILSFISNNKNLIFKDNINLNENHYKIIRGIILSDNNSYNLFLNFIDNNLLTINEKNKKIINNKLIDFLKDLNLNDIYILLDKNRRDQFKEVYKNNFIYDIKSNTKKYVLPVLQSIVE